MRRALAALARRAFTRSAARFASTAARDAGAAGDPRGTRAARAVFGRLAAGLGRVGRRRRDRVSRHRRRRPAPCQPPPNRAPPRAAGAPRDRLRRRRGSPTTSGSSTTCARRRAAGRDIEVVVLDADRDGVEQIADALPGRSGIDGDPRRLARQRRRAANSAAPGSNEVSIESHADAIAQLARRARDRCRHPAVRLRRRRRRCRPRLRRPHRRADRRRRRRQHRRDRQRRAAAATGRLEYNRGPVDDDRRREPGGQVDYGGLLAIIVGSTVVEQGPAPVR